MPLGRIYIPPPTTPVKYGSEFSFPQHSIGNNNKFSQKFNHINNTNEEDDIFTQSNNLKNKLNSETSKPPLSFNYNVNINGSSDVDTPSSTNSGKSFRKIEIKILDTKYCDDEDAIHPVKQATEICKGNGSAYDDGDEGSNCDDIYTNSILSKYEVLENKSTQNGTEDEVSSLPPNTFNNVNDERDLDLQERITEVDENVDTENESGSKTNDIVHRGMNSHCVNSENLEELHFEKQKKTTDNNLKTSDINQRNLPYNSKGLKNLGNTCYMNSIIQCLASTKPLLEFCISFLENQSMTATPINKISQPTTSSATNIGKCLSTQTKITKSFVNLLEDMWNLKGKTNSSSRSNHGIAEPSNFRLSITKFAPKFAGFDQHDSQEFLQYALEGFHTELNRSPSSKPDKTRSIEPNNVTSTNNDISNDINENSLNNCDSVDSNCDSINEDNDINNNKSELSNSHDSKICEISVLNGNCDNSSMNANKIDNTKPKIKTYAEILDDKNLSGEEKGKQCLEVYLFKDNSFITDLFLGQFRSTLQCCVCYHESITFEPFWLISVPIPSNKEWTSDTRRTVIDCMQEFTKTEVLDGDEKPTCERCKERRKCKKWYSVERWPKILVIHLKRFAPGGSYRPKISCIVDVPLKNLNFSMFSSSYRSENGNVSLVNGDIEDEEYDEDEQKTEEFEVNNEEITDKSDKIINGSSCSPAEDILYDCYAVSNHSGSLTGGHYTAYCRHPFYEFTGNENEDLDNWNNSWHLYNDRCVSKCNAESVISADAYLLFFERL